MGEEEWPRAGSLRRARFALSGRLAEMSRRGGAPELGFREDQCLRRLAEVLGIPASEIGAALADGEAWSLELPPPDLSRVELLPAAEPVELEGRPRFLADGHLGRLSRELRLLGFDSLERGGLDADEAIETAIAEGRVLLTRDRGLLFRRELARVPGEEARRRAMLVLAAEPYRQLLEVCSRFGLDRLWRPLSLCSACGGELRPASRAEVLPLLPPMVAARYEEFSLCPGCGKAFWKGDHARSIEPLLARLRSDLGPDRGP